MNPPAAEFTRRATALVAEWEVRLGAKVESVSFRDMRTRWGSCTPAKRRIRLSTRLAAKPPECLEYVVAHEIAHILEGTHSARFWAIMTRVMPDWPARRKLLKE
ncbi:MAG: M48 family metallopeptidase [Clostridiales bacterium]|nr:M48 family metallopeptidase [Clostridiales bacterium]